MNRVQFTDLSLQNAISGGPKREYERGNRECMRNERCDQRERSATRALYDDAK